MLFRKLLKKSNTPHHIDMLIWPGFLFSISFVYFLCFGNGLFFLQENRSLFIFSKEYLNDFIVKPGGLLEYAGNFFTQFYFSKVFASLIISLSLLLFYYLFIRINKLLSEDNSFSFPLVLIPSCLMLLMQIREDHFMYHTIGYLLTFVFYLVAVKSGTRRIKYLILVLFPMFFYITGSFALLFLLMYLAYFVAFIKGFQKYFLILILILTAIISFYAFEEILFLQPPDRLLRYPLNLFDINDLAVSKIILVAYIVLLPFIVKIYRNLKVQAGSPLLLTRLSLIIVFSATFCFLGAQYNPGRENDLKIEKFFFEQNWDAIILQNEKVPSKNEISQYYYNLALTGKGQLCDRMFSVRQDYGIGSMVLPRISENVNRSFYYYYTIGLINEAHHLAYESMVLNGISPENLKMLVKTDIINGNYKIAERNINILKKTLHYKSWADRFEKMLYKPDIVSSDPELGNKIRLMPGKDFFIGPDDKENLDLMMMANPDNKKAFEYKMAFLLLEKDYKAVMYQVKKMKDMKYTRIPRHIEESMMIFIDHKDELPYLGDFIINRETEDRFTNFLKDLRINKTENRNEPERSMKNLWGKTFWYYFEFK